MKFLSENEALKYGGEQTKTTSLKVPTTHDGDFDVLVEIYTPNNLEKETKRAAYVYAHGGGAVSLSIDDVRSPLQCLAVDLNVVVFNVDYRLAPETKCPNNIKDFYEAIKYVSKNADSLGIDPAKIVIAGESGGGYICLGAMVLLAENGETDLVKLAIPSVPMVDDYCFSDPLPMTLEERKAHLTMRKIWGNLIAAEFEKQKNNPHLFPGKASEEILEKFPPTIIMESEFDMFITEATRLAGRLRRAGRLLEFFVIPGANHMSGYVPGTKGNKILVETFKTVAKEYIHS
jgi:acetyl esterase/lipase